VDVDEAWSLLLAARRGPASRPFAAPPGRTLDPDAEQLLAIFTPLLRLAARATRPAVLATLGTSMDGRIATANGHSHFVNGTEALAHLHRLRAFADAVVVGANTVAHDDPQLTVRRCAGPSPVRVVIDAHGRLDLSQRVFRETAAPTIVVRADSCGPAQGVETMLLPAAAAGIAPADLRAAFAARGWRLVLVEGGGVTVSRFVAAQAVERLHIAAAPLIIGSGRPAFTLPAIDDLAQALRPRVRHFPLGDDVLFDCAFAAD
jgi:riboflavin-specific deaminase-like protein